MHEGLVSPRGVRRCAVPLLAAGAVLLTPRPAWAHVKWFSDFSYADRPLTVGEAVTPTLLALTLLAAVVIGALVPIDKALAGNAGYRRINDWLEARSDESGTVLRVAAAASLLLAWQAQTLLVPEFHIGEGWLGWSQLALVLLLLFPRTVPVAGAGLLALYAVGVARFGIFHMLDYALYVGAGYFLIVSGARDERVRGSAVPALYATVGFSLCWVALEKIVYPQWGLYVLEQHPQLALGLDLRFFLLGAAFVELALGYLLIIGLLGRPLALTITLVFFLTTTVFGRLEVIGHTLIHGALIVFLLEGPGKVYAPPILLHARTGMRAAFGAVNFVLLLAILLVPYSYGAWRRYEESRSPDATSGTTVLAPSPALPEAAR